MPATFAPEYQAVASETVDSADVQMNQLKNKRTPLKTIEKVRIIVVAIVVRLRFLSIWTTSEPIVKP